MVYTKGCINWTDDQFIDGDFKMRNIWSAFRRGARAFTESHGPGQYATAGYMIVCPHCGKDVFAKGAAQLNTSGMTFFKLDWANKSATTLACTNCGHIQWFAKTPERISQES